MVKPHEAFASVAIESSDRWDLDLFDSSVAF